MAHAVFMRTLIPPNYNAIHKAALIYNFCLVLINIARHNPNSTVLKLVVSLDLNSSIAMVLEEGCFYSHVIMAMSSGRKRPRHGRDSGRHRRRAMLRTICLASMYATRRPP